MKRFVLVMVVLALLLSPLLTLAQDEPAPGSGGVIVIGSTIGTMQGVSLNPLRNTYAGGQFSDITDQMFPTVVGASPFTQYYGKVGDEGVYNALATDWTISEDGRVYTFTLRRDAV